MEPPTIELIIESTGSDGVSEVRKYLNVGTKPRWNAINESSIEVKEDRFDSAHAC
jgi:hypothetical protein